MQLKIGAQSRQLNRQEEDLKALREERELQLVREVKGSLKLFKQGNILKAGRPRQDLKGRSILIGPCNVYIFL